MTNNAKKYSSSECKNSGRSSFSKPLRIQEIFCNIRDSVVLISSQTIIPDGSVSIKNGNGFFIKGHYIICPYSVVCNERNKPDVDIILVTVSNVNMLGKSYCYEAEILGIDAAGNIAILVINKEKQWNIKNPAIEICHPVLHWGKSRSCSPGDKIFIIGETTGFDTLGFTNINISGSAENGVAIGNISDNRYVSYGGYIPGELLLLSNITIKGSQSGLPVIDRKGCIIGMYLNVETPSHLNLALSEFFMRRPVKALIRSSIDKQIPDRYNGFVETVDSIYRFNKSWIGIGGILMSQNDYNTALSDNFIRIPFSLDEIFSKEIVGYRVLSVYVLSPVLEIIFPGDIITHINNCPLGDRKGQISPSLVMWRIRPSDTITIHYLRKKEKFQFSREISIKTSPYLPFYDFPWYAFSMAQIPSEILPILI